MNSTPPRLCEQCREPISRVTASVDPQEITHVMTAGCGHRLSRALATALWNDGYRWTLPVIDGASLVAAERERHVAVEGFTAEHDAQHDEHGLPWAAWAYLDAAVNDTGAVFVEAPNMWPWAPDDWKVEATSTRRLVIAAALIAAEVDRRLHADRQNQREANHG